MEVLVAAVGLEPTTYDLRIMSCPAPIENKADQQLTSEESGKVRQNPQPKRNRKNGEPDVE
jgi:hypothetical protein